MTSESKGIVPATGTPGAEVMIDEDLVRRLLAGQHPDLADLPLRLAESGWDNAMYRLGDNLAVRLPRRAASANLIVHEQTWLPVLAGQLTLPAPIPVRAGTPAYGYPWRWSVLPWLTGVPADVQPPGSDEAALWGRFLRMLHTSPSPLAPANSVRGVPLRQRVEMLEPRLLRLSGATTSITPRLRRIWEAALQAPVDVASTWLHGDLHPRNVLVDQGAISGVIDWGDVTAGDCATDLASIWMLFDDPTARRAAEVAYGPISAATALRAVGWALLLGVVLLDTGLVDNPRNAAIGRSILERLDRQALLHLWPIENSGCAT